MSVVTTTKIGVDGYAVLIHLVVKDIDDLVGGEIYFGEGGVGEFFGKNVNGGGDGGAHNERHEVGGKVRLV